MEKIKKNLGGIYQYLKTKPILVFVILVFILSFLSFHIAFSFDFWRDDWSAIWVLKFAPKLFNFNWGGDSRHPIIVYESLALFPFFKSSYVLWQIEGYLLRVLGSIGVAYMMYGFTKSRRAAFFSGLLFACLIGGLEANTWLSAHYSAIDIVVISLGIYFWVTSLHSFRRLLFALIIIMLAGIIDPSKGIVVIAMTAFWSILTLFQKIDKESFFNFFLHLIALSVVYIIIQKIITLEEFPTFEFLPVIISAWREISVNPGVLINFFSSIGNLISGWVIPVLDSGGLSNPSAQAYYSGLLFALVTVILAIFFLIKKSEFFKITLFFSIWIWLFYIPNWLYEKGLTVGSTHRYVAVSAVGLAVLLGYCLSLINKKVGVLVLILCIVLNIVGANIVLTHEWFTRSANVVEPIWSKVDNDVPKGETNSIFIYEGGDPRVGPDMGWSGSNPFAIRRGIPSTDDFPILPMDMAMVKNLICNKNVMRPADEGWILQKIRIPLSHVHAWSYNNGVLTDISKKVRNDLKPSLNCNYQL